MATVSVIVTTRNEEANLARCLDSIRAQSFTDTEIIVVDNNSHDRTKEIATRYTEQVINLGPERSAQRNHGVSLAKGEYILYLDADMQLEPDVLATCLNALRQDPQLVGLYIPERIAGTGFWIKVRDFERSFYDGTVIDAVRFLKKQTFLEIGGFDSRLSGPEDWDFDKKLRARGPVAVSPCHLWHHEGAFDLERYLAKKSYYAQDFDTYRDKWGRADPDIQKQLGFTYRFVGVFFESGKYLRLLRHPVLTLAMYYLRFLVGWRYLRRQQRRTEGDQR